MIINHNISALNAQRQLTTNTSAVQQSLEKLSSGLRINRAGDDAAGLAISEKMRGQIRGLEQASRNTQDAISMIQTAEGGLNEIHAVLQRGRELSVQASNDTLTEKDRKAIQEEISQLKEEVNRIANDTEFNTINVLNRNTHAISYETLQKYRDALPDLLHKAEKAVMDGFGLKPDGDPSITISFTDIDGESGILAQVGYGVESATNAGVNIAMRFDIADLDEDIDASLEKFGATVAHEMVHAVFARTLNMGSSDGNRAIPKWFNEGSAEYLSGGADRLRIEMNNLINSGKNEEEAVQNIIDAIGDDGQSWGGESINYAAGYAAVRYLDENLGTEGVPISDMEELFTKLSAVEDGKRTATLDNVLSETRWGSIQGFINDFKSSGDSLIQEIYNSTDIGSIVDWDSIDSDNPSDPLAHWNEEIEGVSNDSLTGSITFQIGANEGQSIEMNLRSVNASALGISNIDVVTDADKAITTFDKAIQSVSSYRSELGALQNRLEHTLNITQSSAENLTAAESRIRDVDMAKEMMEFTKNNILSQAAQSMLAQSNQMPNGVLQLLQ